MVFPVVFLEIFSISYILYFEHLNQCSIKIFLKIQLFVVFPMHIFTVYESVSRVCAHFKKIKEKNYWRNWSWQAPTVACQYELENFHLIHFWSSSKDEPGTVHKERPQSEEGSICGHISRKICRHTEGWHPLHLIFDILEFEIENKVCT